MAHKAIHHLGRGLTILVEVACFLALIGLVAWGGLLWRLSQGPLKVDFIAEQIQKAFVSNHEGFDFDAASVMLTWGGKLEPFEVEMRDVVVRRTDGTEVVSMDKIGVQLSKRHLIFGDVAPQIIKIYTPSVHVIRGRDGGLALNVKSAPDAAEQETAPTQAASQTELVKSFFSELQGDSGFGFLKSLQQISIMDARLSYEDQILGTSWRSREADLSFRREDSGLSAQGSFAIDMGAGNQAVARAEATYDWKTGIASGNLSFSDIVPARLAPDSEKLKDLAGIDMSLRGSIDFTLDRDFKLERARFVLGADKGAFNMAGFYKEPLQVKDFYLAGAADGRAGSVDIAELKIDLGGPQLEASATLRTEDGNRRIIAAKGALVNTPFDELHKYWPESLTPDPRWWVTSYLSKGVASRATIDLELAYDPAAEKKVSLNRLGGTLDFHGVTVDYFDPLTPVKDVTGHATFDPKSFNIDLSAGKLKDMTLTKSVIKITDLDIQDEVHHSKIDIKVDLEGPLRTALEVLDGKPLEYPKELGINTSDVAGASTVSVSFKFPLHKALSVDDVQVSANAKLNDVRLGKMVAGMDVTGGPMDLSVNNGALKVKGAGKLDDMPMTFDWTKNFDKKTPVSNAVTAKLPLTAKALANFGVPAEFALAGSVPADITYTEKHDGTSVLEARGDITTAAFTIPVVDYRKAEGKSGSLALNLSMKNRVPVSITGLDVASEGISMKGRLDFTSTGDLKKAQLGNVTFGDSEVAIDATATSDGGYQVKISGRQIDASEFFNNNDSKPKQTVAEKDAEAAIKGTPLKLSLDVARLLTGKDKGLQNVRLNMQRNAWRRIDQLQLNALVGGKSLLVSYVPTSGGRSLQVDAQNAGAALSAFGIMKSVYGGKLTVSGKTGPKDGPRDLRGVAILSDFTLKDAPIIAKLLNAMSLPGILSLLSGEGMSFKKARVNYAWVDRGQPEQQKNQRLIKLWDGKTSGTSLGLTFEGQIDNWADTYDMNGTIIPVSDINKIINMIPIIGNVLTAGGEGIIAATYTLRGPKDDPSVMVNPLSVLAPGILRKIFFEN